jgi:hypothetical protein
LENENGFYGGEPGFFVILNFHNMRKIIIIGFLLITAAFIHPKSVKVMTPPALLLENSLLVIWNGRNANQRLEEMKKTYAPDVHFYEFDSSKAIVGYAAINELISKLQSEWPPESRFVLNKPSQVNHSLQIASWNLGQEGKQPIITGVDVAVIDNNLIKSFYLFIDAPQK